MIADLILKEISKDKFSIGGITFDAFLEMSQRDSVTVTKHPIYSGSNISDHAYVNPVEFDFYIGQTDSTVNSSTVSIPNVTTSRSINARKYLTHLMEQRQLVLLKCKYGDYSVLIDSISTVDNNTTVNSMKARVHMTEIITTQAFSYKTVESASIVDSTNFGEKNSILADNRTDLRKLEMKFGVK